MPWTLTPEPISAPTTRGDYYTAPNAYIYDTLAGTPAWLEQLPVPPPVVHVSEPPSWAMLGGGALLVVILVQWRGRV